MLARLLDVTPNYILKLTQQGVINRAIDEDGKELRGRYSLLAIRDYCRWLRAQMKIGDSGESTYRMLRNQKVGADAEMAQLRLKEYKGQLHHSRDVEFVMTNMVTFFKQRALAVPSRTARLCVGKKFRQIFDTLSDEIALCLRELSGYDAAKFAAASRAYRESQGIDLESLNGETESTDDEAVGG